MENCEAYSRNGKSLATKGFRVLIYFCYDYITETYTIKFRTRKRLFDLPHNTIKVTVQTAVGRRHTHLLQLLHAIELRRPGLELLPKNGEAGSAVRRPSPVRLRVGHRLAEKQHNETHNHCRRSANASYLSGGSSDVLLPGRTDCNLWWPGGMLST